MTRAEKIAAAKLRLATAPPASAPARGAARALPCVHLGADTGERVLCPSCRGGGTSLHVFACAVHGACTAVTRAPGVAGCCAKCPDYRAAG